MLIATFQQRAHCAVGAIGEGIQHHTKKIETSYTRSIWRVIYVGSPNELSKRALQISSPNRDLTVVVVKLVLM